MNKETAVTGIEMLRAKGLLADVDVNDPKFFFMAIIDQIIPDHSMKEASKIAKYFEGSNFDFREIMDAYTTLKTARLQNLIFSAKTASAQLEQQ